MDEKTSPSPASLSGGGGSTTRNGRMANIGSSSNMLTSPSSHRRSSSNSRSRSRSNRRRQKDEDYPNNGSNNKHQKKEHNGDKHHHHHHHRGCCHRFLKSTFTIVIFTSTILLYCFIGAIIFRHLESPAEKARAFKVASLRNHTVAKLWNITDQFNVLYKENWTSLVTTEIAKFQQQLVDVVREGGLDALEPLPLLSLPPPSSNPSTTSVSTTLKASSHVSKTPLPHQNHHQWSLAGSFLYSFSIITTIGYGNIAPKTNEGKIATILYAIFGIPLMLLYLTNVGGILAQAFRFVYGRFCVCSKNHRQKQLQQLQQQRAIQLEQKRSIRRTLRSQSVRLNRQRSNVFGGGDQSHSAMIGGAMTGSRSTPASPLVGQSLGYNTLPSIVHHQHDANVVQQEIPGSTTPNAHPFTMSHSYGVSYSTGGGTGYSSPPPPPLVAYPHTDCPWCIAPSSTTMSHHHPPNPPSTSQQHTLGHYLQPTQSGVHHSNLFETSTSTIRRPSTRQAFASTAAAAAAVIAPTTAKTIALTTTEQVHVPISLSLMILIAYVSGGGFLFSLWEEDWGYLEGSYFCFISLSTIGFGDLVPGNAVVSGEGGSQKRLIICSLYLLVGLALIAMCFNLMQEEVIHKIRNCGRNIGIIRDPEFDEDDDDEDEDEDETDDNDMVVGVVEHDKDIADNNGDHHHRHTTMSIGIGGYQTLTRNPDHSNIDAVGNLMPNSSEIHVAF